jgi:MFS family permease
MDPADPYNWPSWKKNTNLFLIAFHAMMTTFFASGIIPAYEAISVDLGSSLQKTSYLTSMQIVVLGFGPLFWKPVSNRYGRRPVWLLSVLGSGVSNIGCAVSHSYGAMAACRCLVAFFISPAVAIGSGVVFESYFKVQRATKMGIWTLLVTLGPPAGPFFMGFVAYHVGYRWIYWIFAIINAVQFIAYLFLSPETRYIRAEEPVAAQMNNSTSSFKKSYLTFKRIDPTPFKAIEFIEPLFMARHMSMLLPSVAYSIVFGFTSVFLTVEIPQIFLPKFHFNAQQIGLQFLGMIIGSVIGEQLAGPLSDLWMRQAKARHLKRNQSSFVKPEHRLWLSYFGYLLAMVGLIVFGVRTAQAKENHWNVTPIIGIAIAAVGNQVVTTIVTTYMVDTHQSQSSSVGVFVNVVRQTCKYLSSRTYFSAVADSIRSRGFYLSVLATRYGQQHRNWWQRRIDSRNHLRCQCATHGVCPAI